MGARARTRFEPGTILNRILAAALLLAGFALSGRAAPPVTDPIDVTDLAPPNFEVFTAKDGLSEEIWSTVGFDADGFVWAGSASRLARFDGYRWRTREFPEAASLVRDMVTTPDGTLWAIFEREGLVHYRGGEWTFHGGRDFAHRFSRYGVPGQPDRVWVAQGDAMMQWVDGDWIRDPGHAGLPPGTPIKMTRTETLFGSPREWLVRTPGQVWYRSPEPEPGPWLRFAHPDLDMRLFTDLVRTHDRGHEELWFLSYGQGITRVNPDGVRTWRAADGELPSEAIYSAVATHAENGARSLWIASRAGLLRFHEDTLRVYDRGDGLPSNAVRGIKVQHMDDGAPVLWLATEGGMARARLAPSQWRTVSRLGASENGIFGVLLEADGKGGERLFIGSAKEGIAMLHRGQWRHFTVDSGHLPSNAVRALWKLDGPDGTPWRLAAMGSGHLLRITDDLAFVPVEVPWPVPGDYATAALSAPTPDGARIWFGTHLGSILRLDAAGWHVVHPPVPGRAGEISGLARQTGPDGHDWIWAAGPAGLARFDDHGLNVLAQSRAAADSGYRDVTLIQRNQRSELWAGSTRHGVIRFDVTEPRMPHLIDDDRVPPAPDPTVYGVTQDSAGRIYVCTNNGVQQLTPTGDGGYSQRVFRRRDGLVHDECNTGGQVIDAHDRYWVGTLAGLSMFDPAVQSANGSDHRHPLHLTGARVDGRAVDPSGSSPLVVPPGTRQFGIDYVLLTGQRESEIRYRTRLTGYESEFSAWSREPGRRFGELPPGNYTLVVDGPHDDGQVEIEAAQLVQQRAENLARILDVNETFARDWSGAVSPSRELAIRVVPRWWQRLPVQLAGALATLLLFGGSVMLYNRRLRRRKHHLERVVAQRTAALNTVNARLTDLSYRDPLTGLANRRSLTETAHGILEDACLWQEPVGVIVLDIDRFKPYNDRFGHLAGDAALRAVASILADSVRDGDVVARFGGEEFVCLLPGADTGTAAELAERMRARVQAWQPEDGPADSAVTISAGVVTLVPRPGQPLSELLGRADGALYEAKHAGRNRVCLDGSGTA